jgi:hypothetical protein
VRAGARWLVPLDMASLSASVRFDVRAGVAEVSAVARFEVDGRDGCPVFDLRQGIGRARLDGAELPADALGPVEMGAGWDARMRALDVTCGAGSAHTLELGYQLGAPDATGAPAVEWADGSVAWDLGMSDLEPGRYLESWFPANLCHDTLGIDLTVEVVGTDRPHLLLANGEVVDQQAGRRWAVRYPANFTSLSPLLVLQPADAVEVVEGGAANTGLRRRAVRLPGADVDMAAAVADIDAWLGYCVTRYGRWSHGREFLAVLWGATRGMEYDGATTTAELALEHEIFHSWFGRGVKPAWARDGWMDEAMATWATSARRAGGTPRFWSEELGLDQAPTRLCLPHPWARHTPREAYGAGARLLAGVAHMAGGPAALRAALAAWHREKGGRAASTGELGRHLSKWCGRDLKPWWDRYVHGAGGDG